MHQPPKNKTRLSRFTEIATSIVGTNSYMFTLVFSRQRNINGAFGISDWDCVAGAKAAGCTKIVDVTMRIEVRGSDTGSFCRDWP